MPTLAISVGLTACASAYSAQIAYSELSDSIPQFQEERANAAVAYLADEGVAGLEGGGDGSTFSYVPTEQSGA